VAAFACVTGRRTL
jgi:hypothetical protein